MARTYHGVVLDSATHSPLAGVEVSGRYYYNYRFAPSLDGLFLRRGVSVSGITDRNGKFQVRLRGFNRSIQVIHHPYELWRAHVTKWPKGKEIIIELERSK